MIKQKTTIVGHRGCGTSEVGGSSVYPENSLFSFKNAMDLKIDGVELDVWLTKDNKVIVMHGDNDGLVGDTLCCDKEMVNKYIEELTSQEIQTIHFKKPWILKKRGNDYSDNNKELNKLLGEDEELERLRSCEDFDNVYLNFEENEEIEKIINDNFLYNSLTNTNDERTNDDEIKENEKKIYEELEIDENIEEKEFIENIKCPYCKIVYKNHLSKKNYEFKRKQLIFKFISMFYHIPLLKYILMLFKNKISYDIELKGTKENLGLYILDILENFKGLQCKFSSFNWILQDNNIKKKISKNKNLRKLNYSAYPFYNVGSIDLLKVLKNNKLNIPLALLFVDDEIMPNINSILCSMKYYNAQWVHFPYTLNKKPIVLNCNKKDKYISLEYLFKILHNNNKKIMVYWGPNDCGNDDIPYYIKLSVDSICTNNIALAKNVMQKIYA